MAAAAPPPDEAARPPGSDARWFVALRPDERARARLGLLAARLARESRGRAVPAENVHLTLQFIGLAPRARETDLLALVRSLPPPAPLSLEQVGGFGDRLIWIGPRACPGWLERMPERLREGLDGLGIAYDRKRFVPHLTLVRGARARPRPRGDAPGAAPDAVAVEGWTACLVESELLAGGSRYRWLPA